MNVWIIGAGSIGNHLSQACRSLGWSVTVTDLDSRALARMRDQIYPSRYGAWDSTIELREATGFFPAVGEYDIIMIGTPPESHLDLAKMALKLKPRLLHIEKPLCTPGDDLDAFEEAMRETTDTIVTIGYDHAVSESFSRVIEYITAGEIGKIITVDTMTRESFRGVLAAHPWLAGVHETYLGYWARGGGALCEHSHALHLGLLAAHAGALGDLCQVSATLDLVHTPSGASYDRLAHLVLCNSAGKVVQVTQDVVTEPTRKELWVQGSMGRLELYLSAGLDTVTLVKDAKLVSVQEFRKKRPDDFLALVQHYEHLLDGSVRAEDTPLSVKTGVQVMLHIQQAFSSLR